MWPKGYVLIIFSACGMFCVRSMWMFFILFTYACKRELLRELAYNERMNSQNNCDVHFRMHIRIMIIFIGTRHRGKLSQLINRKKDQDWWTAQGHWKATSSSRIKLNERKGEEDRRLRQRQTFRLMVQRRKEGAKKNFVFSCQCHGSYDILRRE